MVLSKVIFQGQSLTLALTETHHTLADNDKALVQQLCFGVCRFGHQLEVITTHFLSKPIKAKEREVQCLAWLGVYQLLYTRIPDHAAIGATVDAAKEFGRPWASGLLNGILRNVQRAILAKTSPWPETLEATTSHPSWLVNTLQLAWPEHWQAITEANNDQAPMTLRVNALQQTRTEYLATLQHTDIQASACLFSEQGILLERPAPVDKLAGFWEGHASVQDEAAQLATYLLDLKPGQRVLDACAAPGGKTCHILEHQPQLAELVAVELEPSRMARIEENTTRLKLNPKLICADVSDLGAWWDNRAFDRILLDAPCSGTGVIRRHPDIKWLRRASDIDQLAQLQQLMLNTLWATLKPGGLLVYATCSVLPQENETNVSLFLANTADAEPVAINANWGVAQKLGRQLFPQKNGHDGFYYALIKKRA